MGIAIRPAEPTDCRVLSDLAIRSKGHWGYGAEFLEACRAELTVDPVDVERRRVMLAEENGKILGFYAIGGEAPANGDLWFFFVEPTQIGLGIGRLLWRHCVAEARRLGLLGIRIESDPFAEGFYLAMGATRVGAAPSQSMPGRSLPLLRFDLDGSGS